MTTAIERFEDFKQRINEMGLEPFVVYQQENTDKYDIKILDTKVISYNLIQNAVMGLIAHFENRKWIKNWQYIYIMKSRHSITFTNESD